MIEFIKLKGLILTAVPILMSCSNILTDSSNTKTDDAYIFEAEKLIDRQKYVEAIEVLQEVSVSRLNQRSTQLILATAYAGHCGLNFIEMIQNLTASSGGLFLMLMQSFPTSVEDPLISCLAAEQTLMAFGDIAQLKADESLLLALASFSKIGAFLSFNADKDDDGSVDSGFDPCDVADLDDESVAEVGVSLTIALLSLSSTATSALDDTLDDIIAFCPIIDGAIQVVTGDPSYEGFCERTEASGWTSEEILVIRSIINSQDIGLGVCTDDLQNCICTP